MLWLQDIENNCKAFYKVRPFGDESDEEEWNSAQIVKIDWIEVDIAEDQQT
jgi:hypothetical protein